MIKNRLFSSCCPEILESSNFRINLKSKLNLTPEIFQFYIRPISSNYMLYTPANVLMSATCR